MLVWGGVGCFGLVLRWAEFHVLSEHSCVEGPARWGLPRSPLARFPMGCCQNVFFWLHVRGRLSSPSSESLSGFEPRSGTRGDFSGRTVRVFLKV